MSGVNKNWGPISRVALGKIDDIRAIRFLDAKVGDFSLIGSEKNEDMNVKKKMVITYYKLPESGVPMAAKIQRILVSCGGKNSAIATLPLPTICC